MSPAVHCDWSVLTKLILRLLYVSNELDEAFAGAWNSLLRPISELKLSYRSRLAILDNHTHQHTRDWLNSTSKTTRTNQYRQKIPHTQQDRLHASS